MQAFYLIFQFHLLVANFATCTFICSIPYWQSLRLTLTITKIYFDILRLIIFNLQNCQQAKCQKNTCFHEQFETKFACSFQGENANNELLLWPSPIWHYYAPVCHFIDFHAWSIPYLTCVPTFRPAWKNWDTHYMFPHCYYKDLVPLATLFLKTSWSYFQRPWTSRYHWTILFAQFVNRQNQCQHFAHSWTRTNFLCHDNNNTPTHFLYGHKTFHITTLKHGSNTRYHMSNLSVSQRLKNRRTTNQFIILLPLKCKLEIATVIECNDGVRTNDLPIQCVSRCMLPTYTTV